MRTGRSILCGWAVVSELIGREREFAVCTDVLGQLVAQGCRVLSARPAAAEARLSYVALGDMLADVADEVLPRLSEPQRNALEVALLRSEPTGPLRQRAVAAAFLSALSLLAEECPAVVAVDDVQWLDPSSAGVLAYACRRLENERAGFLLSVRQGPDRAVARDALVASLPQDRTRHIALAGFSIGALHRILRAQLEGVLPRPLLVRVATASGGNPLFALEIARAVLSTDGRVSPGEALPVPETIASVLGDRIDVLSPGCRRVLLSTSAMVHPTRSGIEHVVGSTEETRLALAEAEDAGIIRVDGERIGFAHPLFASTLYASAGSARRRSLHRQLAEVATDLEERAWHLARAATGTDEHAAQLLEQAARSARGRGAPDSAAELAQVSMRLTPPASRAEAIRRAMEAADCCFEAGDTARARTLLEQLVAQLAPGPERAEALLRLACVRHYDEDRQEALVLLMEALREAHDAPALRGWIHAVLARMNAWASDVDSGLSHARTALRLAEGSADPALLYLALTAVAMCEIFAGNGLPRQHLENALALEEPTSFLTPVLAAWHPWINFASLLIYVEEFETASTRLDAMLEHAVEAGDEGSVPELRFWLGELECRTGNFALAKRHAVAGYEAAVDTGQQLMVAQLSSAPPGPRRCAPREMARAPPH